MAKGGFRGMPGGGMNQAAMMKQAQKMQQEMMRLQAEHEAKTFSAAAGGGMVKVTMQGSKKVTGIELKPEVVDPDDIEMLQDLIVAAINDCTGKIDAASEEKMGKYTAGLPM